MDRETVTSTLLRSFGDLMGRSATPSYAEAHRWRYAQPVNPLPEPCGFDPKSMIGIAGDWCDGPRVEGAFLSGVAVAGRLLGRTPDVIPETLFEDAAAALPR